MNLYCCLLALLNATHSEQGSRKAIEGFLTNVATLKVTMNYEVRKGMVPLSIISGLRKHQQPKLEFASENRRQLLQGTWATNGTVQKTFYECLPEVAKEVRELFDKGQRTFQSHLPRTLLENAESVVACEPGGMMLDFGPKRSSYTCPAGPFVFWGNNLPEYFVKDWGKSLTLKSGTSVYFGHSVETVLLENRLDKITQWLYCVFDSNIGYLPRFIGALRLKRMAV